MYEEFAYCFSVRHLDEKPMNLFKFSTIHACSILLVIKHTYYIYYF